MNPFGWILPGGGDNTTTAEPSTSSGQGHANNPVLVLGTYQTLIIPFDPSVMGQMISGLGGVLAGGLSGIFALPGGSGRCGNFSVNWFL